MNYVDIQVERKGYHQRYDKKKFRLSLTEFRDGDIKIVNTKETRTIYEYKNGVFKLKKILRKEWYIECKKKYKLVKY